MKRMLIITICILFIITGCTAKDAFELSVTQGRILKCKNDILVLISDGSPIILNVDDLSDIKSFSDGDLIEVWHDGVEESYPARTKAYKIKLVKKGNMADVDETVAGSLSEMGWIEYDDMCQRYLEAGYIINCETPDDRIECNYLYCDMSLEIPENWVYETKRSDSECYIRFKPKAEDSGWVVLECMDVQFAVCGTGLKTDEVLIGAYKANIGYYDDNQQFSYIRFRDVPGEFVVSNIENNGWFEKYENEIMSILNTVTLSPDQLSYDEIYTISDGEIDEYESRYAWFNCFEGVWTVDVYKDGVRYQMKIDTAGNIISELEALK